METKHEKFIRLAEGRANRAIDSIRSLAKLANKNHYDFTEAEVRAIFSTLKQELEDARTVYQAILTKEDKNRFKLTAKKGN
jgi:hypothetical protein